MLNSKNFRLVNAGLYWIPLKSAGLCSGLQLSCLQIDPVQTQVEPEQQSKGVCQ